MDPQAFDAQDLDDSGAPSRPQWKPLASMKRGRVSWVLGTAPFDEGSCSFLGEGLTHISLVEKDTYAAEARGSYEAEHPEGYGALSTAPMLNSMQNFTRHPCCMPPKERSSAQRSSCLSSGPSLLIMLAGRGCSAKKNSTASIERSPPCAEYSEMYAHSFTSFRLNLTSPHAATTTGPIIQSGHEALARAFLHERLNETIAHRPGVLDLV